MIVHRLLDAVFRTLDTIDAVRARVDAVMGRADAQPPSQWPATVDGNVIVETAAVVNDRDAVRAAYTAAPDVDAWRAAPAPSVPARASARVAKKTPSSSSTSTSTDDQGATKAPAKKKKASQAAARPRKEKPVSKVPAPTSRKGSVDRSGKDFDSPRARAVEAWLTSTGAPILAEDAELDGKKTLARVLWAVAVAEQAGSDGGLTAADTSALLSSVASVEVYATNVARTFRDESELFEETTPDGRSKRYTVTARGRARSAGLQMR